MRLNNKAKTSTGPHVKLVIEDKEQSTQVYSLANHRALKGRAVKEYRVILKNGPRFTIDSDKLGTFIRRSTDNKLIGLVKNGKLKRSRVEQKFFLSKLDLIPKGDTDEESNTNPDDLSSYSSVLSPPPATSPSTTNQSLSPHPSTSSSHGSV